MIQNFMDHDLPVNMLAGIFVFAVINNFACNFFSGFTMVEKFNPKIWVIKTLRLFIDVVTYSPKAPSPKFVL